MLKYIVFCPLNLRVYPSFFNSRALQQFLYSSQRRNPYEVLGLKTTCTTRDVKKAYIKLCKELHPDMKPGDSSQHKKFVELNEAYTTLIESKSKRKSVRHRSPNDFENIWKPTSYTARDYQHYWSSEKPWYENEEYQEYMHRRDKEYKAKWSNKTANKWVIAGCFILMILGSVLYFSAYSYATKYTTEKVDEKSRRISESYNDVRKNALNKGKVEQLDDLKKKWSEH